MATGMAPGSVAGAYPASAKASVDRKEHHNAWSDVSREAGLSPVATERHCNWTAYFTFFLSK